MDLACEEQLQAVERRISSLNASADIVRTHRSQVALDRLLGRGGFGASPSSQPLDHGAIQGHPSQHAAHADAHKAPQTARADVHEESHTHQAGVGTVCLRVAGAVSLARCAPVGGGGGGVVCVKWDSELQGLWAEACRGGVVLLRLWAEACRGEVVLLRPAWY